LSLVFCYTVALCAWH